MRIESDKTLILNKIKSHYGFKKDAEFARFLGIKPNSLANWYSRNTLDYEKVFSKCEHINANWLLSGEGEMFINDTTSNISANITVASDEIIKYNEDYWRGRYDQLKEDYDRLLSQLEITKSSAS